MNNSLIQLSVAICTTPIVIKRTNNHPIAPTSKILFNKHVTSTKSKIKRAHISNAVCCCYVTANNYLLLALNTNCSARWKNINPSVFLRKALLTLLIYANMHLKILWICAKMHHNATITVQSLMWPSSHLQIQPLYYFLYQYYSIFNVKGLLILPIQLGINTEQLV